MGKFDNAANRGVMKIKPYIPGKPIEEVRREYGIKDIIKLASNENPMGPSKLAVRAMAKKLGEVSLYPESSAYNLRNALAMQLNIRKDMLVFGNGSNELLNMLAQAFVTPGDEVVFSTLSFTVYQSAADMTGGTAIMIPHKDFAHDIDGFIKRLSDRTKLVYLCNPNNPTGTIISKQDFEKFMEAVKPETIVALDEAYFEFVDDRNCPDGMQYLSKYPNLVVLRTFSKVYGLAGVRVGYAAADPEIISIIERVRASFNVNMPAQAAAEAALRDKAHVEKTLKNNNDGKKYLYAELEKLGIEYVPTNANFIFVKFPANCNVVFEALLKKGVIIRPQYDNYGRITIGTASQNKRLIAALKQVL
ncbi:MAG: histidinol-phosphate transaminase [Spirochaetia bacterium]|nr:histidinol-phosphate transaminase [Spirochaetia bacterium]